MGELKKIEMELATTGKTTFEVSKDSAISLFQHFVRGYMGRTDLASGMGLAHSQDVDFSINLERVRNYLSVQDSGAALEILEQMNPSNDYEVAEHNLEIARCHFINGQFQNCINKLDLNFSNKEALPVTLMTSYQLKGRCLQLMGRVVEAEQALLSSHTLSMAYPFSNSGFVAKAFLVQLYSESQKQIKAQEFLSIIENVLNAEISVDLWATRKLIALRAQSHYLRAFGTKEELKKTLLLAKALAEFLNDKYMIGRCTDELVVLSDLNEDKQVYTFTSWSYIPELKLIVKLFPKEFIRLNDNPIMVDILNHLILGSQSQDNLFQLVWKIPYQERHANHLRATFSKLRKHLPTGALSVSDGIVSLV